MGSPACLLILKILQTIPQNIKPSLLSPSPDPDGLLPTLRTTVYRGVRLADLLINIGHRLLLRTRFGGSELFLHSCCCCPRHTFSIRGRLVLFRLLPFAQSLWRNCKVRSISYVRESQAICRGTWPSEVWKPPPSRPGRSYSTRVPRSSTISKTQPCSVMRFWGQCAGHRGPWAEIHG